MNYLDIIIGFLWFLFGLVIVFISFMLFWKFYFLRNPVRVIPPGKRIVSPADGKIIDILTFKGKDEVHIKKGKYGNIYTLTKDVSDNVLVVSIFMNVFDVHVNRAPYDGKVLKVKHSHGKFNPASDICASVENEKTEVLFSNSSFKFKVIQVAGLVARRVENYLSENQNIIKGQVIGRINLGSQVILVLPSNFDVKVSKGQKVTAGESVIAVPQ